MKVAVTINQNSVNMREVAQDFTQSVLFKAMEQPAKRMQSVMRTLAPIETGALRRSIDYKILSYPSSGVAVAVVGVKSKYRSNGRRPSKYAHLVEYGHIAVKPIKGATIRKKRRRWIKAQKVTFVAPQPFVRPAILAMRVWARSEMASELEKHLKVVLQTRRSMRTLGTKL
jgi:HK97 gp10 family phage protein